MATHEPTSDGVMSGAAIFNSAVTAAAINAAHQLGVFGRLERDGHLEVRAFALANALHRPTLEAILVALASFRIVELDDGREKVLPGPCFAEISRLKGFFYWLIGGYGEILTNLPTTARLAGRGGDVARRDVRAVSIASADMSAVNVDGLFRSVIESLTFDVCADLGCGSAQRLITMARQRPELRGVGVDVAPAALDVAATAVTAAGLASRITLVEADVSTLRRRPDFTGVQLVTCFFLGHDFWPRDRCVRTLRRIRAAFPQAEHLLLCDTHRCAAVPSATDQIFSLGFELTHAAMGQYLPTIAEWRGVFEDSGWDCVAEHQATIPAATVIFHLRPGGVS
ncbi:class I SAM-dependent methyltransferase [Virgisporangium aurantiacum]|uniref:Methyltransferase domain-containing protein n=1 Tax=Virgisporangium aurantiacum TaxID=175570 RepID=A0A8J3ZKF0_9ACTN|nr:class I SAM-dependent methyltransferase [Virgisporangium aurantiacum]GIJ63126.1 hypothetical protein Vau01_106420 [Virgisporangium aurantiacum]